MGGGWGEGQGMLMKLRELGGGSGGGGSERNGRRRVDMIKTHCMEISKN